MSDYLSFAALGAIGLWAVYCVACLLLLVSVPLVWRIQPPRGAITNGFVVYIPEHWKTLLTAEEYRAVVLHEEGHVAHGHTIRNLLAQCLLMPPSFDRRERQEYEADDYVASRGLGTAFASALLKLSDAPFDRARAYRLLCNDSRFGLKFHAGASSAPHPDLSKADNRSSSDESLPQVWYPRPDSQGTGLRFPVHRVRAHQSEHGHQGARPETLG